MPTLDCLHRHIFLLHVYRSVSLSRMRRYMQLAYLFHQRAKSLLSRDSRIADCAVRHPGVERPFSSLQFVAIKNILNVESILCFKFLWLQLTFPEIRVATYCNCKTVCYCHCLFDAQKNLFSTKLFQSLYSSFTFLNLKIEHSNFQHLNQMALLCNSQKKKKHFFNIIVYL